MSAMRTSGARAAPRAAISAETLLHEAWRFGLGRQPRGLGRGGFRALRLFGKSRG